MFSENYSFLSFAKIESDLWPIWRKEFSSYVEQAESAWTHIVRACYGTDEGVAQDGLRSNCRTSLSKHLHFIPKPSFVCDPVHPPAAFTGRSPSVFHKPVLSNIAKILQILSRVLPNKLLAIFSSCLVSTSDIRRSWLPCRCMQTLQN